MTSLLNISYDKMITNHKQTNKYNKIKLKKNNYNSNILNKDYETTLITLL